MAKTTVTLPKKNCWEFKNCGRQPGGTKVEELGLCPAATNERYNGKNEGKNAGRYCWKVAGTLCGGKLQGTYAEKMENCLACEFYKGVKLEQEYKFVV